MDDFSERVRSFVRGEVSWKDLRNSGVSVSFLPSGVRIEGPPNRFEVVRLEDAAAGYARLSRNFTDLCEWAKVLLGATFLELDHQFEGTGDKLLAGIWDAAFNIQPSSESLDVARNICGTTEVQP